MDLAKKILQLRKSRGMSQDELGEQLSVSWQSVSKWESGQATPELDKLAKLAKFFDVTTDYLIHSSETDELIFKTMTLEREQKKILEGQTQVRNRQFSIMSIGISLLLIVALFVISKYVMFPDYGDGHVFLGKAILVSGSLVIVSLNIFTNWRIRNNPKSISSERN